MTKQRFTKLYKFLFEDSTFNKLSIKAKLLYALLTEGSVAKLKIM
ncbi:MULTISPECIES: replication initiator protein A [Staphylococcus]|nr:MULTISPECIES: replication initiator protein A [Staphylococcus]MCI2765643.1 replication initiator protein A [Staphylococcus lugdunensis]MCI2772455.1 replication initiator protein A [Staphylococcus warneri]MCI2785142.1 replication initiator protein A [Staphylococcus warneri]MCI2802248.1 replication initiator protein A [Staphylococcus lugdunensis]MCI2956029.1 replication initiator protein A [Staphylococcus caprae]